MMRVRSKSPAYIARLVAIVAGGLVVGAFTVAVSVAGITRYDQPERALAALPFDAVANTTLADRILQTAPGRQGEAEALARRAIIRTPLSPGAMRVLGFVADERGDRALAMRRIEYAARLSRRDLPTNLWLIEDAIRRNDVPATLDRYDVALRTSRLAAPVLFPVLAGALADPEFVPPVTALLRRDPPWLIEFVPWALHQGVASENITHVLENLLAGSKDRDRQLAVTAIGQLVGEQRYGVAARFLASPIARNAGAKGDDARQFGRFDDSAGIPPFTWFVSQTSDLGGEVAGNRLLVTVGGGGAGIAASRLLALSPGRYRLTVMRSSDARLAAGSIKWTVVCGVPAERVLAELAIPPDAHPVTFDFDVDGKCDGQWLRLVVRNPSRDEELKAIVSAVDLTRLQSRGSDDG